MPMRKIFATAAILGLAGIAAPASAATLLATSGTPLLETIKDNPGTTGNLIVFSSTPSSFLIDYSSTDMLQASSTGGFAFAEGLNTSTGFSNLTITPETVTFSEFKFNMHLPAASPVPPNKTDFSFDTTVFFSGGGSQSFTTDVGSGTGENRYLITAGLSEAIDKIVFSNLVGKVNGVSTGYNFDSLRQVSFDAVGEVPEPATWALFILGLGFAGATLRVARERGALQAA